MGLGGCRILISVDGVSICGWIRAVWVEVSWCRRCCIDCRYDGEIILEFVKVDVGIGKGMVKWIEKGRIMRAK